MQKLITAQFVLTICTDTFRGPQWERCVCDAWPRCRLNAPTRVRSVMTLGIPLRLNGGGCFVFFLQRGLDAICSLMGECYWITKWRPSPRERSSRGAQHMDPSSGLLLLFALNMVVHFLSVIYSRNISWPQTIHLVCKNKPLCD